MKRRRWKLLILIVAVPLLLVFLLQWWVRGRFNPAEIVKRIEEARNCRASIGTASVRLFGFPARVEVHDLKLTPREPAVKPARPGETFINVDHIVLEVNLLSLMFGELDVQRALIEGVAMQTVKWAEGGNSLRLLLARPGTSALPPIVPLTLEDEDEIPAPAGDGPGGEDRPFHISELPLTSTLREARISNASWAMRNERKGTAMRFTDATAVLSGMTLDPENPAASKAAQVDLGTRFILDSAEPNIRTLDFLLALDGRYLLFDPATGYLSSDLEFQLSVKKGSLINRIPTLIKLNESLLKLRNSTGLSLELPPQANLLTDTPIKARLKDGVIRFTDTVFFPFDTYQVGLDKESWLSLRDQQHQFAGRLLASGEISKKAIAGIREFVEKKSAGLADLLGTAVIDKLVNPAGNIELPFESAGQIGRPDVALSESFMDAIKRSGTEAGKDLLKDALEGGDKLENLIKSVKDGVKKEDK